MSWVTSVQEQLLSAEAERSPLEVATLLGLLAQEGVRPNHPNNPAVSTELLTAAAENALDAFAAVQETDHWSVSWDRLSLVTEVCAAAHILGNEDAVAASAAIVAGLVRAFPEVWAAESLAAEAMLQKELDRNSRPIWVAVADAARAAEELAQS